MTITVAAIQAQLDPAGTGMAANIVSQAHVSDTVDEFYVVGLTSAPGRSRFCQTTAAQTAAQQAAAILVALRA